MSNWFVGFTMGLLTILAYNKIYDEPPAIEVPITSNDIVEAYKAGKRDALRTNPVSFELEQTCLEVWANKQPVDVK